MRWFRSRDSWMKAISCARSSHDLAVGKREVPSSRQNAMVLAALAACGAAARPIREQQPPCRARDEPAQVAAAPAVAKATMTRAAAAMAVAGKQTVPVGRRHRREPAVPSSRRPAELEAMFACVDLTGFGRGL